MESDQLVASPPAPRRWSFAGFALLLLRLGLALLTLALLALAVPVTCPAQRPWSGRLGAVERQLGATSPAQALQILAKAVATARTIKAQVLQIRAQLEHELDLGLDPVKQKQQSEARCVLHTLSVAEAISKVVMNLKAAVAVCGEDALFQLLPGDLGHLVRKLKRWVCVVNVELVLANFFSIASNLADAAVSCSLAANLSSSLELEQRIDAECVAAGVTLVNSLVSFSAGLQISIPGCEIVADGLQDRLRDGLGSLKMGAGDFGSLGHLSKQEREELREKIESELTPANFGSLAGQLHIYDQNPGRRLFLGGGPENLMGMCVVDVFQALTQLALMGVTLDGIQENCQDESFGPITAEAVPKPLRDRVSNSFRAGCAVDVSKVLANLGIAVLYLSFTSFHCTNRVNLKAICGAGIAGIEASLAGLAGSGAGAYEACKEGKRLKQTEFLIGKALTSFIKEESEDVLESVCPTLSLECFIEFKEFFTDCPSGLNATCPESISRDSCPGIDACVTEFEAYRSTAQGSPWFRGLTAADFVSFVNMTQSCFAYLDCFKTLSEPSTAMRGLLLKKIFGPQVNQVNGTSWPIEDLNLNHLEELWPKIRGPANFSGPSELLEAHRRGAEILQGAAAAAHEEVCAR